MYACPNCGAGLKYDIATKKLICEFCGTQKETTDFDEVDGSKEEQYFEATRYTCTQCGAELVSTDNTGAAFCSFCGASLLLEGRLSNEKKPDYIIPFSRTKKDCADTYAQMMKNAIFAPNELKDPKYIDGFRGIYMPYWIYDVKNSGHFNFDGETHERIGDFDITRYYALSGNIDANYFGMSHDASFEFSDDISEAIAPYNIKNMEAFHGAYLSGFYADISDVNPELYSGDAIEYANSVSLSEIRSKQEFRKYSVSNFGNAHKPPFNVSQNKPKYALFPVWFMSYRNNDRIAYVTINGETGKIAADIPVDIKKYILYSLILAIPVFICINSASFTNVYELLEVCMALSVGAFICSCMEINAILKKDLGLEDKGLQSKGLAKSEKPSVIGTVFSRIFKKRELLGILLTLVSFIVALAIIVINPVSDIYFYGASIFSIVSTALGFIDVMKDHNVLITRKLPQFNREGGNDNANL